MTMAMNLWRRSGFLSIRAGLLAVSRGIERHSGWFGIPAVARGLVDLQQTMGPSANAADAGGAAPRLRPAIAR